MADSNTHIINKVNASIHCGPQSAKTIQELGLASRITSSLEGLLPVLNELFHKKTVRLEALTVTLNVNTDQLPVFDDLLQKSLKDAFSQLDKAEDIATPKISKEAANLKPHQVFLYFLENGSLPWFSAQVTYAEVYFSEVDFKPQCLEILRTNSEARKRLIQQFEKQEVFSVLKLLYPKSFINPLVELAQFIANTTGRYSTRYAAGFRLEQFILVSGLDYLQLQQGVYTLYDFLEVSRRRIATEIKKERNGQHRLFLESIKEELEVRQLLEIDFEKKTNGSNQKKSSFEESLELGEAFASDSWSKELKEGQLVSNAGLILLHPFIKRFFNKVGLLENNRFISIDHKERGVCLLHNLATGELLFPEEKMLFYKFLCDYPSDRPVAKELPISDFELDEVRQVLQSAIDHWTVLKNTSIAGLRTNFLHRKGLLERDAMGCTLHIESQTADILLDQLPWGISAAHWPWLPHLLTIKWR